MIDTRIPLLSQDYTYVLSKDLSGDRGLIIVGVGRSGERGFQMLYRFSEVCDRLRECRVNVAFVYPKESSRHVLDPISLLSSKCKRSPAFLLDDNGRFFRAGPEATSLRAIYLDHDMKYVSFTDVALQGENWDSLLHAFFAKAASACVGPIQLIEKNGRMTKLVTNVAGDE
jgi:hypothetical protein